MITFLKSKGPERLNSICVTEYFQTVTRQISRLDLNLRLPPAARISEAFRIHFGIQLMFVSVKNLDDETTKLILTDQNKGVLIWCRYATIEEHEQNYSCQKNILLVALNMIIKPKAEEKVRRTISPTPSQNGTSVISTLKFPKKRRIQDSDIVPVHKNPVLIVEKNKDDLKKDTFKSKVLFQPNNDPHNIEKKHLRKISQDKFIPPKTNLKNVDPDTLSKLSHDNIFQQNFEQKNENNETLNKLSKNNQLKTNVQTKQEVKSNHQAIIDLQNDSLSENSKSAEDILEFLNDCDQYPDIKNIGVLRVELLQLSKLDLIQIEISSLKSAYSRQTLSREKVGLVVYLSDALRYQQVWIKLLKNRSPSEISTIESIAGNLELFKSVDIEFLMETKLISNQKRIDAFNCRVNLIENCFPGGKNLMQITLGLLKIARLIIIKEIKRVHFMTRTDREFELSRRKSLESTMKIFLKKRAQITDCEVIELL